MKLPIKEAEEKGFIKSVQKIKLDNDSKNVLKEGVLFNAPDNEQLEDGCFAVSVINSVNIDKMVEREVFTDYLYSPLKRSFSSLVRITALVLRACRKFMLQRKGRMTKPNELEKYNVKPAKFSIFTIAKEAASKKICLRDDELSVALEYIYRTATIEVKKFNNLNVLKRITVESYGILYC